MTEQERIDIIRTHTESGLSCAKIAPFVDCSAGRVNQIQRQYGMERPSRWVVGRPTREELLACGDMTGAEICKKFKRSHGVVKKWMEYYEIVRPHNGCKKSNLIDLREIKDLASDGMCAAHIAEKTGHSAFKIVRIVKESNIELQAGDPNAASRKRPERSEFTKAYANFTLGELSSIYGVAKGTVSKWALHYGLRPAAPKRRPRLMHKDVCTRPIAGSCSQRAIERALAKLERRA